MKYFIFILLLAPLTLQAEMVDRIVARVNNTMITQSDINEAIRNLDHVTSFIENPDERARKKAAFKNDMVNTLINERLLAEEVAKENIVVTEADVDRALQGMAARHQTNLDGLKARMREQGVTYEKYRENMRKDLEKDEFLRRKVYPRIKLTDYDLEEYYKKNTRDFMGFSQVHFLEILVNAQSPIEGMSPEVFANQLVTKIRKGEVDFKTAAKKYSQGPYAPQDGDSGLVNTNEMRSDLVNFLLNLKNGEVSDPINTPNGALIFKLVEKRNQQVRPFNDVKELVRQACGQAQVAEEVENYVRELRARSFIEIKS